MPNFFSAGGVSIGLRPQDLLRRLHAPSSYDEPHHGNAMVGGHIWCLPHKRDAKLLDGRLATKKLASHVDELILMQENMNISFAVGVCDQERANENTAAAAGRRKLVGGQRQAHDISEDVHKQLTTILGMIRSLGDGAERERKASQKRMPGEDVVELLEQLIGADVPVQLLAQLDNLEFEARKDVMNVCCALLRPGMPQQIDKQVVEYLRYHPKLFQVLVAGYSNEETALLHGVVLRSCARHEELAEAFLTSGLVFELVKHARHPSIDISSDAFYTLREMLLAHKEVAAAWMEENFAGFFELYNALLMSGEYIAERQAQKLLTEILLDKHFRKVMVAYVSNEQHLQIHMNLLKDRSKVIQLEAYHIFKIFVANPTKPVRIQQILYRNRGKLVALLESLRVAKHEDAKLRDEVQNVIDKLSRLSAPSVPVQHQHHQQHH